MQTDNVSATGNENETEEEKEPGRDLFSKARWLS